MSTNVRFSPPPGHFFLLVGRSQLTYSGILVYTGVVDPDYEGSVHVMVKNTTDRPFQIEEGMALAQALCLKHFIPVDDGVVARRLSSSGVAGEKSKSFSYSQILNPRILLGISAKESGMEVGAAVAPDPGKK